MNKYFASGLLLIFSISFLGGCSGKQEPEVVPPSDLSGFNENLDTDAQKLYAQARILWNAEEECSDPEKALELLDVAIELEPDYADAYIRRALAASQLGEWNEAFDDSSRAIRLESRPDHYALRSLIFMREGNYKGARMDLERALKLDPQNSRARDYQKKLNSLEAENR